MSNRELVRVVLDDPTLGTRRTVGTLARARSGSRSVLSFRYTDGWVAAGDGFDLDPILPRARGDAYMDTIRGVLSDSAPDRWGRLLMDRREALRARSESRRYRTLDEWDFLVGVHDQTRMGALRFADGDRYLSDEPLTIPPATRLRELEHWTSVIERGLPDDLGDEEWVTMLLVPGSSLGGARPKATYTGPEGAPWLAKFPSQGDRHDVGAWEFVATRLADRAGIAVPTIDLLSLSGLYRTFAARRFDRIGPHRRLYASAMSLTGHLDGEEASYLDIVEAIERYAAPGAVGEQLETLFRRAVFNILAGNRDDHLRNHGFLRNPRGWELSPAFDINPDPDRREHALSIDGMTRLPDLDALRATGPFYRLSASHADAVIADVRGALSEWAREARDVNIPRAEVQRMAAVFAVDDVLRG